MNTFTYDTFVPKHIIPRDIEYGYLSTECVCHPSKPAIQVNKVPVKITIKWDYEETSHEWIQRYKGFVCWDLSMEVTYPLIPSQSHSFGDHSCKTFTNIDSDNTEAIQYMIRDIIDRCIEVSDDAKWEQMLIRPDIRRGSCKSMEYSINSMNIVHKAWEWCNKHGLSYRDISPYLNHIRSQYIQRCILYNYCGPVELPEEK